MCDIFLHRARIVDFVPHYLLWRHGKKEFFNGWLEQEELLQQRKHVNLSFKGIVYDSGEGLLIFMLIFELNSNKYTPLFSDPLNSRE